MTEHAFLPAINGLSCDGSKLPHYWCVICAMCNEPDCKLYVEHLPNSNEVFVDKDGPVNHPVHYTTNSIECIEAIEAALTPEEFRGYIKGNVIKYVWREKQKGKVEDLKKAAWYLNKEIKRSEDEGSTNGSQNT